MVFPMDKARIVELLRPFLTWPLSDGQLKYISTYIDILLKWNQRINLTAVRQPEEIASRHFGESLFTAQALFPAQVGAGAPTCPAERGSGPSVIDIGSGAGFPGLPIKVWAPGIRLTLIESSHKKATFLKEVVRALGLQSVEVFTGRAETFPAGSADIVTLRAVERFENIVPIAAGLVSPGGRLALLIGNSQIDQAKAVANDLDWQAAVRVPLSNNRVLLAARKLSRMPRS